MTSVIFDENFDGNDLILSADAEGITDVSSFDIETEENTVMTVEEVMPETAAFSRTRGAIKLDKVYKFKKSIKLGGAEVSCEVKMKNPQVEFRLRTAPADVRVIFSGNADVSFSGEVNLAEVAGIDEIYIGTIGMPGVGGIDLYVDVALEGSVSLTTTGKMRFGVGYTRADGFMFIREFRSTGFSFVAEASASLGLTAKLGVSECAIITAYAYYSIGGKAGVEVKLYTDGARPTECCNFAAYLYMKFGVKAGIKIGGYSQSFEKTYTVWDEESSPVRVIRHYEDSRHVCECARGNPIDYFTTWDSIYAGSAWLKGSGGVGFKRDRTPVIIYNYSLNENNEATITSYVGNATILNIPSKIDGYPIVALDRYSFQNNNYLRDVKIPDSVTVIGCGAFRDCKNLRKIYLPKDVAAGQYAADNYMYPAPFAGCSQLEEVTFAEGTTVIKSAILHQTGLRSVTIPDTVTTIGTKAFGNSPDLSSVTWSSSLTEIGREAFANCTSLTELIFPDSLTVIGCGAFLNCTGVKKIYLPKDVAAGQYAAENKEYPTPFQGASSLEEIVFAEGTSTIKSAVLYNTGIRFVVIPDTVTSIGPKAFGYSPNLENIVWSKNLTSIGNQAFIENTSLKEVILPESLRTMGDDVFKKCTSVEKVYIPDGLTAAKNAFYECSALKTVEFGGTPIKVFQGMFARSGLETIEIPESVKLIDTDAFNLCESLNKVVLHPGVEIIGPYSFADCSALKELILPNTVKELYKEAFARSGLESMILPDSIEFIHDYHTFKDCKSLKTVTLPSGRKNIGSYMFSGCSALESVVIPAGLEMIGDHCFMNCTSLKEITLGNKVTTIAAYAFENCDSISSIVIPDSVTSLGEGAFYDCDTLKDVTLGNGITSISKRLFENCDIIESVTIPYWVTTIGADVFKNCVKFNSITIPRATTSAQESAFSYPSALTIYGVAGTYAETFASEIGATFVNKEVKATEVTLNKTEVTINKGSTEKLIMTVTPADFTDEISWRSSDENVVTVSENGTITARNTGTATLKLTVGSVSTTCKVTVLQPVTSVYFSKSSVSVEALSETGLTVSVSPSNAENKTLLWTSSAPEIASVDENGKVTAHKKGEATIKAEATDGSGKYDTCKIIVTNNGVIAESIDELESPHNYETNCTDFWVYTLEGAQSINVTFHESTNTEDGFDHIEIYDKAGNKQTFTGTALAGKTITLEGDTVKIKLDSDSAGTEWGFKVTSVTAADSHEHSYTGVVTKPATETQTGIMTYTCSCGDSYTEEIPMLGNEDDTITITESENTVELTNGDIMITDIADVASLLEMTSGNVSVIKADGSTAAPSDIPGTGMKLVLTDSEGNITDEKTLVVYGDVDGDGTISSSDARAALRASVGLDSLDSAQNSASDVEIDGAISSSDARCILRASVGLDSLEEMFKNYYKD